MEAAMSGKGIRLKIQVTLGYLVSLAIVSFVIGAFVAAIVMGAGR
jgi:hypothetical protein